jgi:hypothetical protein
MERRDPSVAVATIRSHIQAGKKNVMADLRQRQAIRGIQSLETNSEKF